MTSARRGNPSCEGKVKFASYALAGRAARHKKGRHPYHCSACGSFHVGSQLSHTLGRRPRLDPEMA